MRISNLEARRASYAYTSNGKELRIELLVIGRGQDCWQVLVMTTTSDSAPAAERILKSVLIGAG